MPTWVGGGFLVTLALFVPASWPQEPILENFLQEEQASSEDAENILQELLATPWDLNTTTFAELDRLPFLSASQIDSFLSHRKNAVYYSDIEEALAALQVQGDTLALCRRVFKIVAPRAARSAPAWHAQLRWRLSAPAAPEPNWPGPQYRNYQRLQWQKGELRAGILMDRDPGETTWDDQRACYAQWERSYKRASWKVLLGNYQMEWGQGLVFWSAYRASQTADVHALARQWGRGALPFLSAYENFSLAGMALDRHWRGVQLIAFASVQRYDAHLRAQTYAVRYDDSGYHRTAHEIIEAKTLQEKIWGGGLQIGDHGQTLGFLYYTARYTPPWQIDDPATDYFSLTGTQNALASVTGHWRSRVLDGAFEVAASAHGAKAGSLVLSSAQKNWAWTLGIHHVETGFHSPHGLSPGTEHGAPAGEGGYAAGLTYRPCPGMTTEFFYQLTHSLWPTATLPFPAPRLRWGATVTWKGPSQLQFFLRYYRSGNEYVQRAELERAPAQQLPQQNESIRVQLTQWLAQKIRMSPRLDFARETQQYATPHQNEGGNNFELLPEKRAGAWGTALSFDFLWRIATKVQLSFRHVIFDTLVPIYLYESDLPGVFTVQALRERGARRYIYLHLNAFRHASVSIKFAETEQQEAALLAATRHAWGVQVDWSR